MITAACQNGPAGSIVFLEDSGLLHLFCLFSTVRTQDPLCPGRVLMGTWWNLPLLWDNVLKCCVHIPLRLAPTGLSISFCCVFIIMHIIFSFWECPFYFKYLWTIIGLCKSDRVNAPLDMFFFLFFWSLFGSNFNFTVNLPKCECFRNYLTEAGKI